MVPMKKLKKKKPVRNKKRKTGARAKPVVQSTHQVGGDAPGMELVTFLKTALEHQQAGRVDEAEKFYRMALGIDPNNSIALQLLGVLAQQKEAFQEAVELFKKALEITPDKAEIYNNLGNSLTALGHNEEAIKSLEKALELEPEYAAAHNSLGVALTNCDRLEDATRTLGRSLELNPDNASAHNNLGNALERSGKFDEAIDQYNQALKLQPHFPNAYYNLGVAFEKAELFDDAIKAYEIAVNMEPNYAEAYYNLGNVFKEMGNIGDARGQYDKALSVNPAYAEAHNNMGIVLKDAGLMQEAEESWQSASKSDANVAEADINLANVFRETGRQNEAIARYQKAIDTRPDYAAPYNNLGIVLSEVGRLEESEQNFRRAIELEENFADAHMNLANILFMIGDVSDGWEEYEWRSKAEDVESPKRLFSQAQWAGEALEGKSLLLWGEQGVGDEIRYASLIPDMLEKGATVSIECTPRLVDLFSRSFPQATVHPYPFTDAENGNIDFDYQCPFPGLGRFLRPNVESFAAQRQSYMVPDQGRKEFWKDRLAAISSRPKIGINWRSMKVINKWRHFYASIEELAPIMSLSGVDFVNMMCDVHDDELAEFESLYGVKLLAWDDIDLKDDLDEAAALNASLDMVVSCLSSATEMSGAVGIPTLGFMGERRHFIMLGSGDAIWYPNTKYFSKDREESWQPVFEGIAEEIRRTFAIT